MKIEIYNLNWLVSGNKTNAYQRALALNEFKKLKAYVRELEQLALTGVVQAKPEVCDHDWISSIAKKENNAPVYCHKCKKWVQTEQFEAPKSC